MQRCEHLEKLTSHPDRGVDSNDSKESVLVEMRYQSKMRGSNLPATAAADKALLTEPFQITPWNKLKI